MSDMNTSSDSPASALSSDERRRSALGLLAASVLGGLSAVWAMFLWGQLLLARQGGTTFCSVDGAADCTQLWDGSFASAVHKMTFVPVAGWGVIFGFACLVVPAAALFRLATNDDATALITGTRLLALVGALSVVLLLVASFMGGAFCTGCLGTYILTALFSGVALATLRGFDAFPQALMATGGAVGLAFLVALYPGAQTPKSKSDTITKAIRDAAPAAGTKTAAHGPDDGHDHGKADTPQNPAAQGPQNPSDQLRMFIRNLPPEMKQAMADSLHVYKTAPAVPVHPARSVIGNKDAKILITDFTDARCGHCAQLHATLKEIYEVVPPDAFKVEPRHFPLDGNCNPGVPRKSPDQVGCVAARAQICMEGNDKAFDFSGQLFENGPTLDAKKVMELAAKYNDMGKLKTCMASPETEKKLKDDIAWAEAHKLEGTPLVLINGKKGTAFGPFVFAMILSGGNADDPAFSALPAANPQAHLH